MQCAPCFNASSHEGHDIVFSISSDSGGCCDCGDDEAWKRPLGCKYHEISAVLPPAVGSSGSGSALKTEAQGEMEIYAEDAAGLLHSKGKSRAMDEDQRAGAPHSKTAVAAASDLTALLNSIPRDIKGAIEEHVGTLLDYVLDTLEHAPEEVVIPKTSGAFHQIHSAETLAPEGHDETSSSAVASASEDGNPSEVDADGDESMSETESAASNRLNVPGAFRDDEFWLDHAVGYLSSGDHQGDDDDEDDDGAYTNYNGRRVMEATTPRPGGGGESKRKQAAAGKADGSSKKGRFYTLLLWNDEKHDFTQVIDIVMDVTGRNMAQAKAVAERVDKHGREIIEVSKDVPKLLLWGLKLNSIDLAVSIRPAYDVFAEDVAGLLVKHILDLAQSVLHVPDRSASSAGEEDAEMTSRSTHPLDNLVPSAALMRALVTNQLLAPWDHLKPVYAESMSSKFFSAEDLRRLDGMLLLESRLWKELRGNVKEAIMACIGIKETKKEIGESLHAC